MRTRTANRRRPQEDNVKRKKLSPNGLPINSNDWTYEDWRDLHNAIETVKRKVGERHAKGDGDSASKEATPMHRAQLPHD